eukprot:4449018-Amphidinium_carterae.1
MAAGDSNKVACNIASHSHIACAASGLYGLQFQETAELYELVSFRIRTLESKTPPTLSAFPQRRAQFCVAVLAEVVQ